MTEIDYFVIFSFAHRWAVFYYCLIPWGKLILILREQEIFAFSFNLYPGLRKIMKLFLLERNFDRL